MGIQIQEEKLLFTLNTKRTTYQMHVDRYGYLLHQYYGRKTEGDMHFLLTFNDRGFSGNPYEAEGDRTYSMDFLPQEFPYLGNGDYRRVLLKVADDLGTIDCDLRYDSFRVEEGMFSIPNLPAVYVDDTNADTGANAQTLVITLKDDLLKLRVDLYYGVLPKLDIITRAVRIVNEGETSFTLEKAQSACLDFVTGDYDAITFYGRHCMERNMQRQHVGHGTLTIGSTRGTSSHQYNPSMLLVDHMATEDYGHCYGMSFVYSGGFKGEIEKDQYNNIRMQLGLHDELLAYPLEGGQEFWTPEVVMSYSAKGMARLSQNFQRCARRHICRGKWRDIPRPVLLNSWEACYFDFDGDKLIELARGARDLGVEMLVMDDGWFGARSDDYRGLGDWFVNEKKLGRSLGDLVSEINNMGLKFGIWVEPEMVNEDSDLYREHPDWAMTIPGRHPVLGRNQLILDFSRKEVVDAIYDAISKVLDSANIEYVKWDFNRSIFNVYSHGGLSQGQVLYNYVLGLYDFLERLNRNYPDVLIEGCSGGGGRFDMGMLYYTPQIWCSDNTDAIDRTRIQYGTSFLYPVSSMGAHVSAVPNEQTGRNVSLKTRSMVAMGGTFGYELDPSKLSEEEKEEIRLQIEDYHRYADLINHGLFYRLSNPAEDEIAAWEMFSEDGREALISAVCLAVHGNMTVNYVRLRGLKKDCFYQDEETGRVYPANALMQIGLPIPVEMGEYRSYRWHFVKV